VDAFTILRIAGHRSITASQRFTPPPEAMERAFERLQLAGKSADTQAENEAKRLQPLQHPLHSTERRL